MQILCATDFSAPAVRAADVAAALAKAQGIPLRIIHCVPSWPLIVEPGITESLWEAWSLHLNNEAERLRATGIEVNSEVRRGSASQDLLAAAGEHPTQMIVVGATGAGLAERWLMGAVPGRVAESAPVPTLVVRQPDRLLSWLKGENRLRVLCGVDFNLSSDAALIAVRDLQRMGSIELEAAHVREMSSSSFADFVFAPSPLEHPHDAPEADAGRDVWDRVNDVLGEPPMKVHAPGASKHRDHELVQLADERDAGLIVVGTHQRHGLGRLGSHSFSRGVMTHAATNVLCVPAASVTLPFRIPQLRRVLVATDLSSPGHDPLRYALGLLPGRGEIRVIHIIPMPTQGINPLVRSVTYFDNTITSDKAVTAAQAALDSMIAHLPRRQGLHVSAEAIIHENTAAGICASAGHFGADVICMGTSGHSRAGTAILGSVMQAVTAKSPCPVLVIPPPAA